MIYNIDWLLMSAQMLATIYRDPTLLSFIFVSKKPLFELSNRFSLFRKRINEELSYNSQHLIFEYLLNKRFNNALAGIYIKSREVVVSDTYTYYKNEGQETIVMYTESEYTLDPTLTATYIYNDNEQDVTDFTVFVQWHKGA